MDGLSVIDGRSVALSTGNGGDGVGSVVGDTGLAVGGPVGPRVGAAVACATGEAVGGGIVGAATGGNVGGIVGTADGAPTGLVLGLEVVGGAGVGAKLPSVSERVNSDQNSSSSSSIRKCSLFPRTPTADVGDSTAMKMEANMKSVLILLL